MPSCQGVPSVLPETNQGNKSFMVFWHQGCKKFWNCTQKKKLKNVRHCSKFHGFILLQTYCGMFKCKLRISELEKFVLLKSVIT